MVMNVKDGKWPGKNTHLYRGETPKSAKQVDISMVAAGLELPAVERLRKCLLDAIRTHSGEAQAISILIAALRRRHAGKPALGICGCGAVTSQIFHGGSCQPCQDCHRIRCRERYRRKALKGRASRAGR